MYLADASEKSGDPELPLNSTSSRWLTYGRAKSQIVRYPNSGAIRWSRNSISRIRWFFTIG